MSAEFKCKDLGLAAFLSLIGVEYLRTQRVNPRTVEFIFADPLGECERIGQDYYSGAGVDDAQRLCCCYSDLLKTITPAKLEGVFRAKE